MYNKPEPMKGNSFLPQTFKYLSSYASKCIPFGSDCGKTEFIEAQVKAFSMELNQENVNPIETMNNCIQQEFLDHSTLIYFST